MDDLFVARRPVRDPTLYVSTSSVTTPGEAPDDGENWFVLANAPTGVAADWEAEADRVVARLGVAERVRRARVRSPADLEAETGALGGAIYGDAPHGRLGSVGRPGHRVRGVRNLWRVGGTGPSRRRPAARDARRGARGAGARPGVRRALAAGGAALALALAGCGAPEEERVADEERPAPTAPAPAPPPAPRTPERPDLPLDVSVAFAGTGAEGAWVLRRPGEREDPVVVFLHGWTAVDPAVYRSWLAHLVRRGSTVVYPVYQDAPFLAPALAFDAMVAGIRAALEQEGLPREDWVLAGHSAGGALERGLRRAGRGARGLQTGRVGLRGPTRWRQLPRHPARAARGRPGADPCAPTRPRRPLRARYDRTGRRP
jgi:hypothetical protein